LAQTKGLHGPIFSARPVAIPEKSRPAQMKQVRVFLYVLYVTVLSVIKTHVIIFYILFRKAVSINTQNSPLWS